MKTPVKIGKKLEKEEQEMSDNWQNKREDGLDKMETIKIIKSLQSKRLKG